MRTQSYDQSSQQNSRFFIASFLLAAMLVLAGCWSSATKLVVIDVLDPENHQDCHITGSINIPFEQFEDRIKTMSKKDSYVLYCSNYACTAAPFCAQLLKDAGFQDVGVFHGGIVQWYQKGYPYTGQAQKSYPQEENEQMEAVDHPGIKDISAEDLKAALAQQQ